MQVELNIKNDQSERVAYNTAGFPAYVRRGVLSTYPNFQAISHWHDDVEFIHVQSGHMDYNINGTTVHLKEGEGIFVNTRQFHYGFSKNFEECIFICVLIHPMLLCSSPYVEKRYVLPVMENACMPYLVLHPDQEHETDILELLDQMYSCFDGELFAIRMQSLFFHIWENLFLLSDHMEQQTVPGNQHLSALKDMIRFIYNNG